MKKNILKYVMSVFTVVIFTMGMILPAAAYEIFPGISSANALALFADRNMWLGIAVVILGSVFLISLAFLVTVILKTGKKK